MFIFNIFATSPNGIRDIADIPALIICLLRSSGSFAAIALKADIAVLTASAPVPIVGSRPATSNAACNLSINPSVNNLSAYASYIRSVSVSFIIFIFSINHY